MTHLQCYKTVSKKELHSDQPLPPNGFCSCEGQKTTHPQIFLSLPLPPRIPTSHSYLRHVIYSFLWLTACSKESTPNSHYEFLLSPHVPALILKLMFSSLPSLFPSPLLLDFLPCWSSALRGSCIHGNRHCFSSERIWRQTNRLHSMFCTQAFHLHYTTLNKQAPFHLLSQTKCCLVPKPHPMYILFVVCCFQIVKVSVLVMVLSPVWRGLMGYVFMIYTCTISTVFTWLHNNGTQSRGSNLIQQVHVCILFPV